MNDTLHGWGRGDIFETANFAAVSIWRKVRSLRILLPEGVYGKGFGGKF